MTATNSSMTAERTVVVISDDAQLQQALSSAPYAVLNFWADWAPQCAQMNAVFAQLSAKHGSWLRFYQIEAEQVPSVSEAYSIEAVPAFVFLKRDHTGVTNNEAANTLAIVDRVEGANAAHLTRLVEQYSQQAQLTDGLQVVQQAPSAAKETLQQRLQRLTTMAPVVLFMKGTPLEPKCGFSRQIVDLLAKQRVAYTAFDILTDEEVRQGLKEYADWPTYPQLWIGGELAGGLDIAKELAESGELKKLLPAAPADEQMAPLNERLNRLINQSKLVIFIKGTPEEPRCGFSRQLLDLLNELQCHYEYFDILSDEEVRQGLKEYSDWPTYPQVYVDGQLVGGLDIVKEMIQAGEFQAVIQQ